MEADLFDFESYKEFLRAYIDHQKKRGLVSELAKSAGCDRTYLSQSLNSKVQLTPDHALGIASYIGMSDMEQNYFLLLNLFERSNSKLAQDLLKKQMDAIKQENQFLSEKIKDKLKPSELSVEDKDIYYSSWLYPAIHLLTSIEGFQEAEEMSKKSGLPLTKVQRILNQLEALGLVIKKGKLWQNSKKFIHIPRGSVHNTLNHMHWRAKAREQYNNPSSVHYTSIFSLSKKDWNKIKKQILSLIEEQRKSISESGSEDLYCFCCDLFSPFE